MAIRCEQIKNEVIQEYCNQLSYKRTFLSDEEAKRSFTSQVYPDEIERGLDYLQRLRRREPRAVLAATPFSFLNRIQTPTPWKTFPGLFDDLLLTDAVQQVNRLTESLKRRGFKENSPNYDKALSYALIDFFHSPQGWGLKPSSTELTPKNPREVYETRTASCFPFVHPFLVFAKLAKLDAFPVEVYRGKDRGWRHHVEVAIRFQKGTSRERILFINLEEAHPVYRNSKDWREISYNDLVALAYNNWAVSPTLSYSLTNQIPKDILEDQITKFEEALQYSRHYLVLANYAACLFNIGGKENIAKAVALVEEAERLNPDFFTESTIGTIIFGRYHEEKDKLILVSSN